MEREQDLCTLNLVPSVGQDYIEEDGIETTLKEEKEVTGRDLITAWLSEIKSFPLLSPAEEKKLARIMRGDQEGDPTAARKKLINSNLRLVPFIAKKYTGLGLELSDLISEGNIGLIIAVDRFDPDRGYRFSTFAFWWIVQRILRALKNQVSTIRLPDHIHCSINIIEREIKNIERGATANLEEVAKRMGKPLPEIKRLLNLKSIKKTLTLNLPVGDDDEEFGTLLPDNKVPLPDEIVQKLNTRERVLALLDRLAEEEEHPTDRRKAISKKTAKQQKVVLLFRFGLHPDAPGIKLSLHKIGEILGLTRERIRQIEKKALKKLKRLALENDLKAFL